MRPDADRIAGEKGWVFKQDATRGAVSSADPTRQAGGDRRVVGLDLIIAGETGTTVCPTGAMACGPDKQAMVA